MCTIKYVKDHIIELINRIKTFEDIFLFLDYDGTLSGFRREPGDARPSKRIKKIISALADDPNVTTTIVSGRSMDDLLGLFKDFDTSIINWSGVHGLQMKFGSDVLIQSEEISFVLPKIFKIKKELSGIVNKYPCYIFEDKGVSFALHYRKCPKESIVFLDNIKDHLKKYEQDKSVEVLHMKKVIEVKPAGINKGDTIEAVSGRVVKSNFSSINICIGDDITDEYLFRANPGGINIKVGKEESRKVAAEYYLNGVSEVHWFLNKILKRKRKP